MTKKTFITSLLLLLIFGIGDAQADGPLCPQGSYAYDFQTFYISPTGDDAKDGLSQANAWATFDRAWDTTKSTFVAPSDTLTVLDGVYTQTIHPYTCNGDANLAIGIETDTSVYGLDHPERTKYYVKVKAQNDGQVILDGQNLRGPLIQLGDTWPGPIGSRYSVEGIMAKDSSANSVVLITASDFNILKRVSAYNANTDGNSFVMSIVWPSAEYNLIEDCVAAGTGRKMMHFFGASNNIFRRCFANWTNWDGRDWHDGWPWGDEIQVYNATNNIIENNIAWGSEASWGISIQANDPSAITTGNKVLGSISLNAGVNSDGSIRYWGCLTQPEPCDPSERPQPTQYTLIADFDYPASRAGFVVFGQGTLQNNVFKDVFAFQNAGLGVTSTEANPGASLDYATVVGNGLDGRCGGWPCQWGGPDTDAIQNEIDSFSGRTELDIDKLFIDWPGYPTGPRNVTSLNGVGARLTKRYVNGNLTNQDLWPWPMEDRIKSEFTQVFGMQNFSVTCEIGTLINQYTNYPITNINVNDYCSGNPPSILGDANGDNKVDGIDYVIWLNHYNQPTGNGAGDGDFDGDGVVDGVDYVMWLGNYNP